MTKKIKHGDAKKRIYKTWQSMRSRCRNKNHTAFYYYGARGISVCKEWDKSYFNFREWAYSNGYDDSKTIDRIDGTGNYCPDNCRWATYQEQNTNLGMLSTNTSGYKGISWNKKHQKWRCNISINNKTKHIGDFDNIEIAAQARNKFIEDNNLLHQKISLNMRLTR